MADLKSIIQLVTGSKDSIEALPVLTDTLITELKPVAYEFLKQGAEFFNDYADNKDFPKTLAQINKNKYDAYIEVGFTPEQAFQLLLADKTKSTNVASSASATASNALSTTKENSPK